MRKKNRKLKHKSLAKRIVGGILTVSFLTSMPLNGVRASICVAENSKEFCAPHSKEQEYPESTFRRMPKIAAGNKNSKVDSFKTESANTEVETKEVKGVGNTKIQSEKSKIKEVKATNATQETKETRSIYTKPKIKETGSTKTKTEAEEIGNTDVKEEMLVTGKTATDKSHTGKPETEELEGMDSKIKESRIEESKIEESKIKESNIEEFDIEESGIEESGTEESDIKESDIEESDIKESNIEESDIKESNIEESDIEESPIEGSGTEEIRIKESSTEESNIEESGIEESETEEAETASTRETEEMQTEEPEISTTETEETQTEESETEEPETEPVTDASDIASEDILVWKGKGTFGQYHGEYCYRVSPKVYLRQSTNLGVTEEINLFYSVYEIIEDETICLEKDKIIYCGKGIKNSATIRTGFYKAGNYCIVIEREGYLDERKTLREIKYTVSLQQQILSLKESDIEMNYGDIVYLDTILTDSEVQKDDREGSRYPSNYEIVIEDGENAVQVVTYNHKYIQEDEEEIWEDNVDEGEFPEDEENENNEDKSDESSEETSESDESKSDEDTSESDESKSDENSEETGESNESKSDDCKGEESDEDTRESDESKGDESSEDTREWDKRESNESKGDKNAEGGNDENADKRNENDKENKKTMIEDDNRNKDLVEKENESGNKNDQESNDNSVNTRKNVKTFQFPHSTCYRNGQYVPHGKENRIMLGYNKIESSESLFNQDNQRDYIQAIGVNKPGFGEATVSIRLKATPFCAASDPVKLKIKVIPIQTNLQIAVPQQVKIYESLPIQIQLTAQENDITEELLANYAKGGIDFYIQPEVQQTDNLSTIQSFEEIVVNTSDLVCDKDKNGGIQYFLPVTNSNFSKLEAGCDYTIRAVFSYKEDASQNIYAPYCCNEGTAKLKLLARAAKLNLFMDQELPLDYRTYFGKNGIAKLIVEIREINNDIENKEDNVPIQEITELEGTKSNVTQHNLQQQELITEEINKIIYQTTDYDANVIEILPQSTLPFSPENNAIPIQVTGVGSTKVQVQASGSKVYTMEPEEIDITVESSSLYDEDFQIKLLSKTGTEQMIFQHAKDGDGFQKWMDYLEAHHYWINSILEVSLSESGAQYYDTIVTNKENVKKGKSIRLESSQNKQEYCFWAEHTERNASTQQTTGGTRKFIVGIDLEAPKIKNFVLDSNDFVPTRTETERYYAQEFVLTGSFTDSVSGVQKVEYTTDFQLPVQEQNWQEAIITQTGEDTAFRIVLSDGSYNAIAVRAYDFAGNRSYTKCLANEKGEWYRIIVDSKAPEIAVAGLSGNMLYTGEAEQWTSNSVQYKVSDTGEGCPYAGIYQFQTAYETIGDAVKNPNNPQLLWKSLLVDAENTSIFQVGAGHPENKNGYYYFRAVSKCGVVSKQPLKERILLQQTISPKKDLVETGAGMRKNEWYNKQSGVPIISFAYPEYDSGVTTGEYHAPITIHYNLSVKDENGNTAILARDTQATIGVQTSDEYRNGEFLVKRDDLSEKSIHFQDRAPDGEIRDGIYTLEYWISDKAGNQSDREIKRYKIDCHEPTNLSVKIADLNLAVDNAENIYYQYVFQNTVDGSASAEYGISTKASIKICKAKNIGDWNQQERLEEGDNFCVTDGNRCFLYVIAEDGAGNTAEGWTQGLVVDNQAPIGNEMAELILEPEGANKNGFYNKDIPVKIHVKDTPDAYNSAALKSVESIVGAKGKSLVTQKELFTFTKETPTEAELIGASRFEIVEWIDAAAYESNEAYIQVTATDRAENSAISVQKLKIDVTKPEIAISFKNNDKEEQYAPYYHTDRTAKIQIKELNFDPKAVEVSITKDGEKYAVPLSDWTSEGVDHYATLVFQEDGTYTMSVICKDLADNIADEVKIDTFTIDKTLPIAEIALMDNRANQLHEGYFNTKVAAKITITEQNFHSEGFRLHTTSHSSISAWNHNGEKHTVQVYFDKEGQHNIGVEYTDLAGNRVAYPQPLTFMIDTQPPEITIAGVADGSANAGEIIPVITVYDVNLAAENTEIEVVTGTGKPVTVAKEVTIAEKISNNPNMTDAGSNSKAFVYTLTDISALSDDIYYLTVTTTDFAGNQEVQTLRFSLNRRGSSYDISRLSTIMDKYYNTYEELADMEIMEMNVDKIEDFHMYLTRNGQMITDEVAFTKEESGSEQLGYTYKYKICKENFEKEGIYRIGFYSKDRAGNEVNNSLDLNGKDIQFVIDDTAPKVVIEGIESGKVYDSTSQAFHVMVTDNFKLKEAEFILLNEDGEELDKWDYCALVKEQGEIATFTIPEQDTELSLLFRASDAAGNVLSGSKNAETTPTNFMVTTNRWVQIGKQPVTIYLEEDMPLVALLIIIPVLIAAAGITAVIVWKQKRNTKAKQ